MTINPHDYKELFEELTFILRRADELTKNLSTKPAFTLYSHRCAAEVKKIKKWLKENE